MEIIEALKILKEHCKSRENCVSSECEILKAVGDCDNLTTVPENWDIREIKKEVLNYE